ncbi:hypothetical protein HYC85_021644, partial [Camellia sinensis]
KINNSKHTQSHSSKSSPRSSSSQAQDHLAVSRLESFEMPMSDDSSEKKLSWLRSQSIGGDVEFESPFGKRRLTNADHTASGRCLHYIENYIINNVLPFYGSSHSSDSYVGERTTKMMLEASQYVKRCLGDREDDALIFCGWGTTTAIKRLQEVMGIAIPSTMRERVLKCLQISSSEERWVARPIQIINRRIKRLRNKEIPLVKVDSKNHGGTYATWETEEDITKRYPDLFPLDPVFF